MLKTAEVIKITTRSLRPRGPYWWSTPGLKKNGNIRGAVTWDWDDDEEILWENPTFWVNAP